MAERCDLCGHEKAMGRCWRLTCPENGAPHGLLDLVTDHPPCQQFSIGEKVAHVRQAPKIETNHPPERKLL
jgi:hypothetical protein